MSGAVEAQGFLERIAAARRKAVVEAAALRPESALLGVTPPARRPFAAALSGGPGPLAVIAEIKRASPSKGALRMDLDPSELAALYAQAGAAAISVLTEPEFFAARPDDLHNARAACGLPVLRKEFIVAPWQLAESRAMGADAVLLIVALLGQQTGAFVDRAAELDLEVVVEVHDAAELELALATRAAVIGINNRNLHTFQVDSGTARRLAPRAAAAGRLVVAESGIRGREDLDGLWEAGVRAILVGESLVRSGDPAGMLGALRGGSAGC